VAETKVAVAVDVPVTWMPANPAGIVMLSGIRKSRTRSPLAAGDDENPKLTGGFDVIGVLVPLSAQPAKQ
jgi:hypothetical protein